MAWCDIHVSQLKRLEFTPRPPMKKQTNATIKAHFVRGAFYLLLLLAACGFRFALAERNSGKVSKQNAGAAASGGGPANTGKLHRLPPDLARMMQPASQKQQLEAHPYMAQTHDWDNTTPTAVLCSKIAFSSNRNGNYEIYVMNPNGTNAIRLTNNTAIDDFPDISPDGSKITFQSNRNGTSEIYVMNSDGSSQTRLTFSGSNTNPSFSPDGTKIVFISTRTGGRGVWVINADGTNETQTRYLRSQRWRTTAF